MNVRYYLEKILPAFVVMLLYSVNVLAQPFTEISLQSQISTVTNNNGVAVADYDNDNDLDFFVVTRWNSDASGPVTSYLFQNNNDGTFTNVTEQSGITSSHSYKGEAIPGIYSFGEKMSASWGDYDNDGFPDLFLTGAFYDELYHNNQDGTFTNVTGQAGFSVKHNCYHTHALWFDVDNDSFLDLYISSVFGCVSAFYRNNQDGTFTHYSDSIGLKGSGLSAWMSIPWDINDDHYQDLYITKDFDQANEFFINQNGDTLVDMAAAFGVEDKNKDGMGITLGDVDNDGLMDFFITNINESSLYRQTSKDVFENIADTLGMAETGWAWGCRFEDFDHDLDLDLMMVTGFSKPSENHFFENLLETGQLQFRDRAADYGMAEPSYSNSIAAFDYDLDGDLDILVTSTNEQLHLYQNEVIEQDSTHVKNWLQVGLEGTTSNRSAIGTQVKITLGDTVLTRIYSGASLMAQSLQPVHFGLGACDSIDQLTLIWPSGITETYNREEIPVNHIIHFTEEQGFELINQTSHKVPGCTDPYSCSYNPDATLEDGSCTYMDAPIISGPSTAGILTVQTYEVPYNKGSSYRWSVDMGEILEGQGEASVKIHWGVAEKGQVWVTEYNTCASDPVVFEVSLNSTDVPEQISVARMWNEVLLNAIRHDYARPTVHARNLFHTSMAMYDAWALFNDTAQTYLIGKENHGYINEFTGFESNEDQAEAVQTAISYAAYRVLTYRFKDSPNHDETQARFDALMNLLGYDARYADTDYSNGNAAALGNFIGQSVIDYGHIDHANEENKYANTYYQPANEPLVPALPGNPSITDPNRWQPLQLDVFIDQAGNVVANNTPEFLSPEWGNVFAFCLNDEAKTTYSRDGDNYAVFLDPGAPPHLNERKLSDEDIDLYKWNFSLVSIWSSHLNPYDSVMWDISPAAIGNINFDDLPRNIEEHNHFYNFKDGGDIGKGRTINPITGEAYQPQIVPRGDYTRVLAEFWADGPDSETPPGHWFVLLNYISDHPDFQRKFKGETLLDPLEWDVKAYFTLGGTMHDAAVASWAVKGWYDFIRPISAIRYMADKGQSTDESLPNYHPDGIPLQKGFIELVEEGDSLAGYDNENVGKIKVYAWKGHDYISNTETDQAGVGWILAENWWPYQRPSFVTPPFAGYVSGHSTYSRAAAEVVTRLTGSEYFPRGMGEFVAKKNEFLVFEEGPSQDVVLQWATYRDASDQCSLSRIWGGIHPPCDDIPGRLLGEKIGKASFHLAEQYFTPTQVNTNTPLASRLGKVYPVPSTDGKVYITQAPTNAEFRLFDSRGAQVYIEAALQNSGEGVRVLNLQPLPKGLYILRSGEHSWKIVLE